MSIKRCENCGHYSGGGCNREWTCPLRDLDGTWRYKDFALPHDIDRLERIIREERKGREYRNALILRATANKWIGAWDCSIESDCSEGMSNFVIALAALTSEQRTEVARKVLEEDSDG